MKANELMIGDWVHSPEFRCSIGTDPEMDRRIQICDFLERPDGTSGVDRYTPIPLTEDILKANGFEIEKSREEWTILLLSDEDGVVETELEFNYDVENGDYYIGFGDVRNAVFIYVHELQHALRLCGLNELADNFKI